MIFYDVCHWGNEARPGVKGLKDFLTAVSGSPGLQGLKLIVAFDLV